MRRPPLAFLGNGEAYTERDNLLLLAHKSYEAERCSCGYRRSVCSREPDRHVWFEVDEADKCHVEAAVQEFTSAEGYKPERGSRLTVVVRKASDLAALSGGEEPAPEADRGED